MQKTMLTNTKTGKKCKDCLHFDNSYHKNYPETMHAGRCTRFHEITFLNDSCNQFLNKDLPPASSVFDVAEQLTLNL